MNKMNKKGVIDQLVPIVLALVTIGLVLVIGLLIFVEVKDQVKDSGDACVTAGQVYNDTNTICCTHINCSLPGAVNRTAPGAVGSSMNGTNQVINAVSDIPSWLPIIVITMIGALLVGLVSVFRKR